MSEINSSLIFRISIRPRKLRNGKFVLYEKTILNEFVPGWGDRHKSVSHVWPPFKQSNGRGRQFDNASDALTALKDYNEINKAVLD